MQKILLIAGVHILMGIYAMDSEPLVLAPWVKEANNITLDNCQWKQSIPIDNETTILSIKHYLHRCGAVEPAQQSLKPLKQQGYVKKIVDEELHDEYKVKEVMHYFGVQRLFFSQRLKRK